MYARIILAASLILNIGLSINSTSIGLGGLECSGLSRGVCDCGDCQCFVQEELLSTVCT